MLASSFPKALVWGPEMITLHNDAFKPILGRKPCAQGRPFPEIWSEAWHEIGPIARRAAAGRATFIENFPLTIERNGYAEDCNFTFCYSPIRNEKGEVEGFIDTVIETTQTVKAQRDLQVMNAELAHRMRNTYTLVSAIARQTLRNADDPGDAWEKLSHRFNALAAGQLALTESPRRNASLAEVIHTSLAAHLDEADMPALSGPDLDLSEREVLPISLAINELATNALKHGALATGGTVAIDWRLQEDGLLELRWSEDGVPGPGTAPRTGFGRQLLETIIPQDVQGEASITHASDRLVYALKGRLSI